MLAPLVGVILWKVYTLMIGTEGASWIDITLHFRYYVVIACIAALLLLIVTPITTEEGKRMIPFFPGMIVGIWIMMLVWPLIAINLSRL